MFRCALMAAFVVVAFTNPALASYWIVRGSDNKCIMVDIEPTDKTITKVGKDVCFTRRSRGRRQEAL
jgi:hypothetical protein